MWYLFLVFALALVCLGVFFIVWRKKRGKRFGFVKVLAAVLSFILAFVFTLYLLLFPPYSPIATTGPYAYTSTTVQYQEDRIETYKTDGSYRKISALIYYPEDANLPLNSCPLVVFSHGGMGYAKSNVSLYQQLASHGYVVVSIDHTYQCLWTTIDGKTIFINNDYMREIMNEDVENDTQNSYALYTKWMDVRMGDMDYVIDYAKQQATLQTDFYSLINPNKIAVMGHSLGGAAALGIGRTRSDVSAVIALEAPFMYDITGVQNNQLIWQTQPYPLPVLNVYTDSSYSHLQQWKQYAQNYNLLNSSAPTVHNAYIQGAGHFSITDLALTSPILTKMLNGIATTATAQQCLTQINTQCLAFLNLYLR